MEILDHMILSVEEILEENKEISFEDAVVRAKKQFGQNDFKKFSNEKLELFRSRERNMYMNSLKTYFSFPKAILTLVFIFLLALFLGIFENPKKISLLFILVFFLISLYQLKFWYKTRKIEGFKIIKNEFYLYGVNSVQLWMHFNNFFDNDSEWLNTLYVRLFFSMTTTLSLLSLLFFIQTRKKIYGEIKSYQQLCN